MELPNLGQNCHLETCKQLDFLPITCDACNNVFCKEHSSYDAHHCALGQRKDRRVPVCPLCNQPISMKPTDSPDQKVNEHIENDCKSDLATHKRTNRCKVKGCKERQLVPILCNSCKQNYCLRHRHENDHNCSAKMSQSNNTAATSRAGQAALSRFQQTSKPTQNYRQQQDKPTSLPKVSTPQHRSTSNRNFAQTSAQTSAGRNVMSEDEALQRALHASLQESSFEPNKNQMTQQEIEDMQLAKALQESENEARKQQNSQSSEKSKDSCVLS